MKKSLGAHTFLYPHPTLLVGTYDAAGRANVATVSWAGVCCSRPPCVAVSLRAATLTHANVAARQAFTVGVPGEGLVDAVDRAGTASGRVEDKFRTTGLTPVRSDLVDAPYAAECPLVLECRLLRTVELGLHTMYVGEIVDAKADEDVLDGNGMPDLAKVRPILFASGTSAYFGVGTRLARAFSRRA